MPVEIYSLRTDAADAWVAWDGKQANDYAYGGCRLVGWRARDEDAVAMLCSLMQYESGYKNTLINQAVAAGALDGLDDRLPSGLLAGRVGGGRCVLRPATAAVAAVLADPGHPEFEGTVRRVFAPLGRLLNELDGRVKLTPDFGKFAGMADVLYDYTPHVLGVSRQNGGCGGKSSFSATGVLAAYETLEQSDLIDSPRVTVIGSAGAMGEPVALHLLGRGDRTVTVCDVSYGGSVRPPDGTRCLPAVAGRFPDEAMAAGDPVIATTWGGELEHSNHQLLPPGARLLLAHNLAIPTGIDGIELMRAVSRPDVLVIPGQVLTLGGALTSRLEWFSRSAGRRTFDKPLAHEVVRRVVGHWVLRLAHGSVRRGNPYEALLEACETTALAGTSV